VRRFWGKPDTNRLIKPAESLANDPKRHRHGNALPNSWRLDPDQLCLIAALYK
jgi:hypothetical protein